MHDPDSLFEALEILHNAIDEGKPANVTVILQLPLGDTTAGLLMEVT